MVIWVFENIVTSIFICFSYPYSLCLFVCFQAASYFQSKSDTISLKRYQKALELYIYETEQIIKSFESIKAFVKNSHTSCNQTRTIGAVSGVAATVAYADLLFAPLTFGLSAAATAVVVAGSVESFASTVVSTVGDTIEVENAKKRIHVCEADH